MSTLWTVRVLHNAGYWINKPHVTLSQHGMPIGNPPNMLIIYSTREESWKMKYLISCLRLHKLAALTHKKQINRNLDLIFPDILNNELFL